MYFCKTNTNFGSGTRFWWRFRRMYTCFRNRKSASTSKEFFRTRKYFFRQNQTHSTNTHTQTNFKIGKKNKPKNDKKKKNSLRKVNTIVYRLGLHKIIAQNPKKTITNNCKII